MLAETADVTDADAIRTVVERCIAEFGRLDSAINNATDGPMPAPLADEMEEHSPVARRALPHLQQGILEQATSTVGVPECMLLSH